ncbi:hypothetical protein U1Q18_031015, partial [Sarracenia purpurea var. burkii]
MGEDRPLCSRYARSGRAMECLERRYGHTKGSPSTDSDPRRLGPERQPEAIKFMGRSNILEAAREIKNVLKRLDQTQGEKDKFHLLISSEWVVILVGFISLLPFYFAHILLAACIHSTNGRATPPTNTGLFGKSTSIDGGWLDGEHSDSYFVHLGPESNSRRKWKAFQYSMMSPP